MTTMIDMKKRKFLEWRGTWGPKDPRKRRLSWIYEHHLRVDIVSLTPQLTEGVSCNSLLATEKVDCSESHLYRISETFKVNFPTSLLYYNTHLLICTMRIFSVGKNNEEKRKKYEPVVSLNPDELRMYITF